ncbi:hypothetical protein NP590_10325 [Methylomonas sp. SURF-2]|uniref:Uncharacterized protein n=1 Tax=Methylomonas subterranea TaxID=2952225 RepID=A0ABT1TGQ5_9GAMM|nr:hypothetical protein [Methylomonas sp. SURF-2]MCQ8104499.1 hypothetical protein [Methylomonas sp. SURF-2]
MKNIDIIVVFATNKTLLGGRCLNGGSKRAESLSNIIQNRHQHPGHDFQISGAISSAKKHCHSRYLRDCRWKSFFACG